MKNVHHISDYDPIRHPDAIALRKKSVRQPRIEPKGTGVFHEAHWHPAWWFLIGTFTGVLISQGVMMIL